MAADIGELTDLDELCVNDDLTDKFLKAAKHLQTLLPDVNNDKLLVLYAYYKQGTEGSCNVPKPSWYDMKGKAKWEAWKNLGNMSQDEAKEFYVKKIEELDPNFSCKDDTTSKEGWVTVSTLQSHKENIEDCKKTIVDHIRDGCIEKFQERLKSTKTDINSLDEEGLGYIHWAADCGSLQSLKLLIEEGADVNLKDSDGQTALHYASSCGHVECLQLLLENGCRCDAVDNDGIDAISVAADSNIEKLLSAAK